MPDPLAGIDREAFAGPLPAAGEALRVAFVGVPSALQASLPPALPGVLEPLPVVLHDGDITSEAGTALAGFAPHVVVAFDPQQQLPDGLLEGFAAAKLGWVTEPLPRRTITGFDPPDLDERLAAQRRADYTGFDRVVCADPLAAAGDSPFWRSRPLPVADALFAPVGPARADARILFVGRSTEHREQWLMMPKHEFELLHYANGLNGDRLLDVFAAADVALNVHPEPFPRFNPGIVRHLAAGHLVISEPLAPYHGLEPGIDFIEVAAKHEVGTVLHQLARRPDTYQRVRLRGRAKAELFRASVVWPRMVGDLLRELAAGD